MELLTRDLPGTGGLHKATPEDFIVDELPAYAPSGEGTHTFVRIEKRGLTTAEAIARLARALGVEQRDVGAAGQKDRQALTRQWLSLPGVDPARALELGGAGIDGVRVLEAARHGNKLRTGHLAGNRFTLTLRGVVPDALERARRIVDRLVEHGMANYFGQQRFGARGDNAARGKQLLAPAATEKGGRGPRVSPNERRMLVSAYQSELFNRYLDRRLLDALVDAPVAGDVLKKTDTGGLFTVDDTPAALADAAARLKARAVVVTGPMFGHKMMAPPAGTPSAAREEALLAAEGIGPESFKILGRLAEGTRRPLVVPVGAASVRPGDAPDALVLEFMLPPGSYATVLLAEVTKSGADAAAT